MFVNFKKVSKDAIVPHYANPGDAGADLYASQDFIVKAHRVGAVPTGIAIELPKSYVAYVNPRSSMAMKGIGILNAPGTIDSGYRGEIKVILVNNTDEDFYVAKGNKIAQLVFQVYHEAVFKEVKELSNSVRGTDGFGSTGE